MPRSQGTAVENNFTVGLVTETTALRYPPNSCTETYDCVFDTSGEVSRRPNFVDESGALTPSLDRTSTDAIVQFQWTAVAGSGSKSFIVLQHGRYLRFYNNSSSNNLSPNRETFTIDLNSYRPSTPTVTPADHPCSFTQGDGKLFVANRGIDPIYVEYDSDSNTITVTTITLKERDFEGATETGWDIDERYLGNIPDLIAADPNHYYNLLNQGWHTSVTNASGFNPGGFSNTDAPLLKWDTARGDLPSNADTPWLYLGTSGDTLGTFDAQTVLTRDGGTLQAPRGHFILDVFGPSRTDAIAHYPDGFEATVTGDRADNKERPQCIAFYAGRLWYAGIDQKDLATKIFFSRIVEKPLHYGQCYQDNDPTVQDLTDLLPSDGGVIKIPEIAEIIRLFASRSSLLVFATNGVWLIKGSDAIGFKANDYVVEQLTAEGTQNRLAFANVKNVPVWMGDNGVFTMQYDANFNSYGVVSLSDERIKSFFQAIPKVSRQYAQGAYDANEDIVYFTYHSVAQSSGTFYTYDRVLVLDMTTKAFYPWTINSYESRVVRGLVYSQSPGSTSNGLIKYLRTINVDSTHETTSYGEATGSTYLDWGNTDYTSYFITGFRIDGQANKHFQSNYVTTLFNSVTNSSCYLQGYFDFSNSGSSGKWSTLSQVYRDRDNRVVTHSRIKVRGKGPSLQLKYTSETAKPFNIIGWVIWITGNASV